MGDLRHVGEAREALTLILAGPPEPEPHAAARAPAFPDAAALARLVEGEILPRLMLTLRGTPRRPARKPEAGEIARFSHALIGPGPIDVAAEVDALLAGGLPLDTLLLDLLAPAARHLGALWEEDHCDFVAVTEGLGRLQAIARRLCARLEEGPAPSGRSILLCPCPGETHAFGLTVVASFFREAGWDVTITTADGASPAELLRAGWYDAVGLSLSCDVFLPALREAVPALRRASRNPGLRVIVGGPWFVRHRAAARAVGADACALDGRAAPAIAQALLDRPALAC